MDLEIVKEAFADDPELLLDELGIEYKSQNHRLSVLCPFHSDNHLGSAFINNGHFHCFACNTSGDCFSLVQEVMRMTFPEAVIFCAQVYGLRLTYEENPTTVKLRLSKRENECLMFPKTVISLNKILKTDEQAYKKIVLEQADKMLKKYKDIITLYGKRDAKEAYMVCRLYKNWSPNTYVEITREAMSRIHVLMDLKERMK